MNINSLLQPFEHFGVNLGLSRIVNLLATLGNPHHQVPIIHVAGTNGKGSVCAYLSAVLTEAGYKTGRYTSPHLVDWTERICINEQSIESSKLCELIQQVQAAINPDSVSPTQFEVITAAAWLYFAQQQVDIAVIEVGLDGVTVSPFVDGKVFKLFHFRSLFAAVPDEQKGGEQNQNQVADRQKDVRQVF